MNNKPFRIFVIEDNDWYNKLLVHNLSLNPDFEVQGFHTGKEFLKHLSQNPDVVSLDYRLPDMEGDELLKKIKDYNKDIEVIIISEQESIETAVSLLKAGAYDYLVKEKNIRDRLLNTVNHIRNNASLKAQVSELQQEVQHKYDFQSSIIGNSPRIQPIFRLIEKASASNITVTVTGETGTGKELVAKAIHYNSDRKDKPFVAVNASAIPAELVESEFFGHEKGAFTGASFRRIGKFEEANGGTLFLDEIGDMDAAFQAKLLRAIQEKEIVRIGSNKPIRTDCRIIVATHKNLQQEVKAGRFREDLYFRLFGLSIELPPLRERSTDILMLAKHFITLACKENNWERKTLSEEARTKLTGYTYPGNIRELKSMIELAVVMADGNEIRPEDIIFGTNEMFGDTLPDADLTLREINRRVVARYMQKYDRNIQTVAEKLDISPSTIYRMLKEKDQA
ncbi:MAG: sigma-54-dependent Fis family transcriptional regulator [Flavobacteriales bacterium]|nr:sigma-54-dependent Fis family transcriptional regulator [Flavobacteriales bacterium]